MVGVVAIGLGRSLLARRILTLSTLLAADVPGALTLLGESFLARLLVTVNTALVPLHLAAAAHLLLSFPTGKLGSRASRRVLVAIYARSGPGCLGDVDGCRGHRLPPMRGRSGTHKVSPSTHQVVVTVLGGCFFVASLLVCWRLVSRYRGAGQRQRRLLRIPYAASLLSAALFGLLLSSGARSGSQPFDDVLGGHGIRSRGPHCATQRRHRPGQRTTLL